jgi:uncharacterized integral membrane protein (TIGR00698 family)
MRVTLARVLMLIGAILCLVPDTRFGSGAQAWMGLLAGIGVSMLVGNPWQTFTKRWTPILLQVSVVGLGANMNLQKVISVGVHGIGYTAAGIALAFVAGTGLAWLLGVSRDVALLVTVGTAICGGSAIAAVAPVIRARSEDVSISLATVFLLNSVGLLLFPVLGHAFGLNQGQFGLWAALAIHDTSSVVGAAKAYGDEALQIATTVKLARALWIVPVTLAIGAWRAREEKEGAGVAKAKKPWFIAGFVAAAALVTYVPALTEAGHVVFLVARQLLVLTLFLIGVNLSVESLKTVGIRPVIHGVLLWAVVGSASLAAIASGYAK